MLYYFPTLHEATARTCALVCLTPTFPLQLALRVTDALCSRQSGQDVSVLISFLVTVLLGRVQSAQLTVSRSRHEALVQAACRAVPTVANPGRQTSHLSDVKSAPVSSLNGSGSLHQCRSMQKDVSAVHRTFKYAAMGTFVNNASVSPASDFPAVPLQWCPVCTPAGVVLLWP